jgi:heme/copper-type cytochrome/quinol oxidase subunit 3
MPYKIAYSGTDKVILQRRSVAGVMVLTIVMGIIFSIIEIALIYLIKNAEPPFSYIRFFFLIFGILAIIGGINYPNIVKARTPESLTFDNNKGYLEIEQDSKNSQKGYIIYEDIAGFEIYKERYSGGSNSGSSRKTYYNYHVVLRKKDHGEWYLREWKQLSQAERMIEELKAIKLMNYSRNVPKSVLSDKLNKESIGDKTILSWRNKLGTSPFIFAAVVLFIGSFMYMMINFVAKDGGFTNVFAYLILGFISLIFLGIVFLQTKRMIKNGTTRFAISISRNNMEYTELDNSGTVKSSRIILLKDIYSIVFSHRSRMKNAPLHILTKEQSDELVQMRLNPINLKSIRNFFSISKEIISLNIEALNAVECLQVENWLQELILNKSEAKVI